MRMPASTFQKLPEFHSNVQPRQPSQVSLAGKGDRDRDRNGGGFRDRLDRDREGEEILLVETVLCSPISLKYIEYFVMGLRGVFAAKSLCRAMRRIHLLESDMVLSLVAGSP